MPELRLNIITRDWVVIATERARRPDEFASEKKEPQHLPAYDPSCPFCPGNEAKTVREVMRRGDGSKWKVRVVPNKFPALAADGERQRSGDGIYHSMTGVGFHEVIIDSTRHDLTTASMSVPEITDVLMVYRDRYAQIRQDPRMEAIIIFKNHGAVAGSSIIHPHSQLAATPVVPFQLRGRIAEAIRFFDENGECVFCRMLQEELAVGSRIIAGSEHFVVFHPYAALSPFHTWIFPRRHAASFDEATAEELADLAQTLKTLLLKLHVGLNDPPYNYAIRSIPTHETNAEYYHWYVTVIPRVTKTAGFEFGSGMFINTALPEESAAFLRSVKV